MSDTEQTVRITLRLPTDLHDSLTKAAASDNRSMNAEIISRLQQSLSEEHVSSPGYWARVSETGEITYRNAQELLSELAELTQRTHVLAQLVHHAQKEDIKAKSKGTKPKK